MSRVLIAISQRVDAWPERGERRDALDQRLCVWIASTGMLPVPIPNLLGADGLELWLEALRPGILLLSGGNNIGLCPERDATEGLLLDHARDRRLPLLGICRGMQMMAVWGGGRLKPIPGHSGSRHRLLGGLDNGPWPEEVDSYHDLAVDGCPPGFLPAAMADDGTLEAMRHAQLPWEGWMWHPERDPVPNPANTSRLSALLGVGERP